MPINKRWSNYTKETVRANETDNYGVYEIGNSTEVLYIGEGHTKTRLLAHFPDAAEPVVGASGYRTEYTQSKQRCVERQNALLAEFKKRYGRLPKYNQRSRN